MVEVIVVIAHDFKSIPQKPYKITVAGNPNSGTVLHVRRSILQQPHLKVETICQPKHENGPTDKIISIFSLHSNGDFVLSLWMNLLLSERRNWFLILCSFIFFLENIMFIMVIIVLSSPFWLVVK